jgi:hypothetical protein
MYGLCFVEGVPSTPEDTENLIKRIAFIRITQCEAPFLLAADRVADIDIPS